MFFFFWNIFATFWLWTFSKIFDVSKIQLFDFEFLGVFDFLKTFYNFWHRTSLRISLIFWNIFTTIWLWISVRFFWFFQIFLQVFDFEFLYDFFDYFKYFNFFDWIFNLKKYNFFDFEFFGNFLFFQILPALSCDFEFTREFFELFENFQKKFKTFWLF